MSADAKEGGWDAMEDMGKLQPSTRGKTKESMAGAVIVWLDA